MRWISLHRTFLFTAVTAGLASALSMLGGIGLEKVAEKALPLVPLIISIPGLSDLVGDYASIIAAHHGDESERMRSSTELSRAIFKVLSINIFAIILMSFGLAALRGYSFESGFVLRFVIFISVAAVISVLFIFGITNLLDRILHSHKMNPDDLLIPITTTVADIVMLLLVTVAVLTIF